MSDAGADPEPAPESTHQPADVPVPQGYGSPPPPRTHHDLLHGRDVPLDPESRRHRQLKHDLAEQGRRVVEAIAMLEALECDPTQIEELLADTRHLAERLERQPNLWKYRGAALGPQGASALDERSPISGQGNPIAPPMHLECDGVTTWGHATYGIAYEGPPLHLHGGWVIAAFDELLGVAQAVSGQPGMTGTITIKLRAPTPLRERIDYEGWVDRVEGRKVFAKGESRLDGRVLAEAEAVFIAPKNWVDAMQGEGPG